MQLKDKIKLALDEGRVLILGGQVLVGFGYQSALQPGFDKLPASSWHLQLASLTVQLVGLALVMSPGARDCLVERGEPSEDFLRFTTRLIGWALLPFAVGLGVSVYVSVQNVGGTQFGTATGVGATLLAVIMWYGLPFALQQPPAPMTNENGTTVELKDKISHALTEIRMVLPGVQAMLGFQFLGILTQSFEQLPSSSKCVHAACLALTAVTIVLLITPAAFHRLAERGEATDRQHRITTSLLLAAMVTLPPAITGDLFVVLRKATDSLPIAIGVSLGMLLFFYSLWFGPGVLLRSRREVSRS